MQVNYFHLFFSATFSVEQIFNFKKIKSYFMYHRENYLKNKTYVLQQDGCLLRDVTKFPTYEVRFPS